MPVEYRPLRSEEQGAALELTVRSFPQASREEARRQVEGDPRRRLEHTWVAVAEDGSLLSQVHHWLRDLRDAEGAPRLTGCVAAVCTHPDARRQGHSGRLLDLVIAAMREEGCQWSLLFTGINRHYERHGWRTMRTSYRQGLLRDGFPEPTGGWTVSAYRPRGEPGGWRPLQRIYDVYNSARPLTLVRDPAYWAAFCGARFLDPRSLVLVASDGDRSPSPVGYLLASLGEEDLTVIEIGALPGREEALAALLSGAARRAAARGIRRMRAYLPREPAIDGALSALLERVETGHHEAVMARSLGSEFGEDRVDAMFAAPGAILWPADDF